MRSRFIFPVVTIAFSVFFYVMTMSFPSAADPLGPAIWPMLIVIGMFIIGVFLFVKELQAFKAEKNTAEKAPDREDGEQATGFIEKYRHWIAFGVMVVFALMMRIIGFPLASLMFINGMAFLLGMRSWKVMLLSSVLASGVISYLFMHLLFMPLPMGSGIFREVSRLFSNR